MSLLSRIRAFFSSLFGGAGERGESAGEEAGDAAAGAGGGATTAEAEAAYRCSICGTPVDDPEGSCPLCRSTDVVPAGEIDAGERPDEGGPTLAGTAVSRPDTDEEAVNRLREIRRQAEAGDGGDDGEAGGDRVETSGDEDGGDDERVGDEGETGDGEGAGDDGAKSGDEGG
ncbi:MAG: hypothetical protein ABEJ22_01515 [Haloferacaceae archaeon]